MRVPPQRPPAPAALCCLRPHPHAVHAALAPPPAAPACAPARPRPAAAHAPQLLESAPAPVVLFWQHAAPLSPPVALVPAAAGMFLTPAPVLEHLPAPAALVPAAA
eukprot:1157279-Pelagomonas_calceolata.AAC.7